VKWPIVLAGLLLALQPSREAVNALDASDAIAGSWVGDIEHEGQRAPVALEFERRDGQLWATLVVPAFHGRAPLGVATVRGSQVELRMMTLDFDPAAGVLSVTLPEGLLPRYRPRMAFRRSAVPYALPPRPDPAAPHREPIWTADVGAPIWADAAVHEGRVFVGADDGRLHAIDAGTGRTSWTFDCGGAIRGPAAFDGDDVLVQSDNGLLHRIDGRTGTRRWQVRIADTPAVRLAIGDPKGRYEFRASGVAIHDGRLFVATHEGRLLALRASSGERVWEFKAGDSITTTPAVTHGLVYVGSFDHHVYAVEETSGALAWKYDTGDAATSDVAPAGDRVIVGSRSYDLESLDARRGRPAWKNYFWFSWVESSPIVVDDRVYVGSSDAAKVFAIDRTTGKSMWDADVLGSAWGRPAVSGARVYQGAVGVLRYSAPHRGVLMALDRRTGSVLWWYEAAPPVPREPPPPTAVPYGFAGSVAVAGGKVFAPGLDGRLYAFQQ
jgi:outer membrane protein assembly factor BamB